MNMYRRHPSNAGLSLLEMAVFLVVLGLLVIAGGRLYTVKVNYDRARDTAVKLQMIKVALDEYVIRVARLPCPASRIAPIDSEDFGIEYKRNTSSERCPNDPDYADPSDPTSGVVYPDLPTNDTARANLNNGNAVRIGTVPTRDLGLPDDAMFDAWGHRLVYAVSENITYNNQLGYDNYFGNVELGITVKDVDDNNAVKEKSIMWLVLSPGLDGRGAYSKNGSPTPPIPCRTDVLAGENCDDDEVFVNSVRKNYSNNDDRFTATMIYGYY